MKKVLTYLGLILAACLVLVACASNKPAEKKKATPTPTERAKADATVLIDTMLGKSSNGFSKLYGENYETWTETSEFITGQIISPNGGFSGLKRKSLKNKLQILSKKRGIHRKTSIRLNTLKATIPRHQPKCFLSSSRSVVI